MKWCFYCSEACSNFCVCGWNPKEWSFNWKLLSSTQSCGAVYHALQCGSNFPSVDEVLKIGHSNESYWAVLSCGTVSAVYYAVQGGSNYWVRGRNPRVWPFKWKRRSSTFLWHCLLCCTRWFWVVSLRMKSLSVVVQTKATKQYFSFKWSFYAEWIPI